MKYEKELKLAIDAVRQASSLCRSVQAQITPEVLEKADSSPVTVADFGSQALICHRLHEAFPDDPIIAEEDSASLREPDQLDLRNQVIKHVTAHQSGDAEDVLLWIDYGGSDEYAPRFWTLDPIDGTKGFLRKEQYAIALALIIDGEPTVAALCCPNLPKDPALGELGESQTGLIFSAVKGEGAWVQPLDDAEAPRESISVSQTRDTREARFCESVESGHSRHDQAAMIARQLEMETESVRMDSQAKYAVVARGEADIYLRLPTRATYVEKIWDHAAGLLVVQEAGGIVTDITGAPLEFKHGARLEKNRGVIVTNGPTHERVLAAVTEIGLE